MWLVMIGLIYRNLQQSIERIDTRRFWREF